MHRSVLDWVRHQRDRLGLEFAPVLEVGSWDPERRLRTLFRGPYLGIDIRNGAGVDRVADITTTPVEELGTFAVVLCCEVLEHATDPWAVAQGCLMQLEPAGHLLLTARGFDERGTFAPHHEVDHWRFSESAMRLMVEHSEPALAELSVEADPDHPGWFVHARVV